MRGWRVRGTLIDVEPEVLLAGGQDAPLRVRLLAVAPVVLFSALVLAVDPTPYIAATAVVVVSPSLVIVVGQRVPTGVCMAAEIGGVAWLMSAWPRIDLSLMVLVYGAGKVGVLRGPWTSAVNYVLSVGVAVGWAIGGGYPRAVGWVIGMTFAWAGGVALRKLLETMLRLRAAQGELAERAVAEERRRIAREVHDLVAHSLAVTMLHLTGARLALADGEFEEAGAALGEAERLGRSSMAGIRHAVGLLTDPTADPDWAPEPDERDIATLVVDYRRAGLQVELRESGLACACDPTVGLAAFRVVQESLANAVRHAPGEAVVVALDWSGDELVVRITNPMSGPASARTQVGHGLVGMRERVEALGGEFAVDCTSGTWRVIARMTTALRVEPERA